MDLKDVYDKKIKKINEGYLEYILMDLKVFVVIWVFDDIIGFKVYIWRCVEVVIKICDIIGEMWILKYVKYCFVNENGLVL